MAKIFYGLFCKITTCLSFSILDILEETSNFLSQHRYVVSFVRNLDAKNSTNGLQNWYMLS